MSESVLKALMRLFAIIANVNKEGVTTNARRIVEAYLKQQFNNDKVREFLNIFDEYLAFHHRNITNKDSRKGRKRNAVNSVKVLMICQEINEALHQREKIIVFLRLLEFIQEDNVVTEKELDFVKTVADIFNISNEEYSDGKAFVLGEDIGQIRQDRLLIVARKKPTVVAEDVTRKLRFMHHKDLDKNLQILHLSSINTFMFRYLGNFDLYLNGQIILPHRTYVLDNGSIIKGAKIKPVYYSNIAAKFLESETRTKIILSADQVEFRFRNSTNGIHHFNLSEASGQLIGVIGGSGVGKSTLLNVLNGKLKPQSGLVTINGIDVHKESDKLEGIIGFVPQDDLLIEELTVFQNLYFNAKLCFTDFSERQTLRTVIKVLKDLDLYEIRKLKVGDTLNKFISGGQRKRLNIALELMRKPTVLYVDEPTSGLSSMDSEMVMLLLKEQALKGRLVIVNIHQPSSDIYKLFDKLIIMDKGGYPIFRGNPIDAVVYFKTMNNYVNADESQCVTCGNVNPEQVLQIIESKVVNEFGKFTRNRKRSAEDWSALYEEHIESKFQKQESKDDLPANNFKIPNKIEQFKIFSIRNILSKLANKQYMLINFLEAPLLAIIIGYFTKYIAGTDSDPNAYLFSDNENLPAYFFMSIIVALFMGLTVSAEEIIKDRKLLKRESFLNLSRFSYINSKTLILFLISAIQTFSFVIVGNFILGIEGMGLNFWLVLFTTSCAANMIGLNISAALNSVVAIYILIPFILVPQLLFSGVIVNFDKLHKNITHEKYVPIIGDLMTSRWAYEALAVTQFRDNEYQKHFFNIERKISNATYMSNFYATELETIANESKLLFQKKNDSIKLESNLKLLKNELITIGLKLTKYKYADIENLEINKFNESVAIDLKKYLKTVKKYYSARYEKYTQKRDAIYSKLWKELGRNQLNDLKTRFYNKSVADLVLAKTDINKIKRTESEILLQKKDPIYKLPETNSGRSHFYASSKKFLGQYIDTFWFNLIIIWLSAIFLYVILIFDLLRKLIDYVAKIGVKNEPAL